MKKNVVGRGRGSFWGVLPTPPPTIKTGTALIKNFTATKVAVKCLIMAVEQKFKVLRKAEKEIYQDMRSDFSYIEKNSAEFGKSAEYSRACVC